MFLIEKLLPLFLNSLNGWQRRLYAALAVLVICAAGGFAQDKPQEVKLRVTTVEGELAFYHYVKVTVENLPEWLKNPENKIQKLRLFVDGNEIPGLIPDAVENNTKLRFDIKRDPDKNKEAWTTVLSRRPKGWSRPVIVSVGLENSSPIPSDQSTNLIVINHFWFWVFVICFLAAIGLFVFLAYQTDILRDPGPQPAGEDDHGKPNRKPFSLARTQMAFWFFIVAISYVFIWMVTTNLSNLTPSVLALIGISAATGLGAAVVDASKQSTQDNLRRVNEEKRKKAEVESQRLQTEVTALTTAINTTPPPANLDELKANLTSKQAELNAKQAEIIQTSQEISKLDDASKPAVSKNFIQDILSDDDGISFHRFQIFAWTIVLILIFIFSVYNVLAMPDFDATLLGLMGISGGTYIGFKLPDKQG